MKCLEEWGQWREHHAEKNANHAGWFPSAAIHVSRVFVVEEETAVKLKALPE